MDSPDIVGEVGEELPRIEVMTRMRRAGLLPIQPTGIVLPGEARWGLCPDPAAAPRKPYKKKHDGCRGDNLVFATQTAT